MKRIMAILLSIVIIAATIPAMPTVAMAETSVTTIDASERHQVMNGFGASGCWWAQDVGGWSNAADVASLLYSGKDGIGLNIYRYNLGAGSVNDSLAYPRTRDTECFLREDGSYNWGADANARRMLAAAKKAAGNDLRVTLFCNSAPIWMTKNGKASCDDYWESNLDAERYDEFAEYCYKCAEHFQSSGYRVTDVSPVNEPYGHWSINDEGTWAGQEGCHYTREEVRDLGVRCIRRFKGTDVESKGCKISLLDANDMATEPDEETELEKYLRCLLGTGLSFSGKNGDIRKNIDTIGMHSYWTTRQAKQNTANVLRDTYGGKYKAAQTEYCQLEWDQTSGVYDLIQQSGMTSGLGIEYGIALANIIYDDLTILDAVEWDWWTAVAFGGYTDGLVYVSEDDHSITTSKRLYAMGNYSKFTTEGSVRIGADTSSGLNTIAFANPDGTISVVMINDGNASVSTTLNVNGINTPCYKYTSYVTDRTRDLAKYRSRSNGTNTVTIPAQSVTTIVIEPCEHRYTTTISPADSKSNGKISGKCSYCGKTTTKTINKIGSATLSATTYTYDGKAKKPTVTVKDSKGNKIASSNYTVSYSNNTKVGKASVKVTFKGNYSGTKTLTFKINPKGTTISKLTTAKKGFTVKWNKQATQATGYEVQYSTSSKFSSPKTMTIAKTGTTSKKITGLTGNKKYYVRIRTYKTVNGTKYYSSWSKAKSVTTKK